MKKLAAWAATWTVPQAIATVGALACVTAFAISITVSDGWGKLVTWLSDGQHQALLLSLAAFLGALYHRALGLEPAASAPPQRIPSSKQDGSVGGDVLGAICFAVAGAALLLHGCGAAASDQQRHDYALEAAHCMEREQAIADRPATTEAQDLADLAAEEARCDEARARIEHPAQDGGV